MIAIAALAGILAFGARLLSLAISRHREELADTSAVALVSPSGLRKALEKLEADHTVLHHVSRATAHMWLETPLKNDGDKKHAKINKMFDTHPPLAERIAILRKLEGLDPDKRGPVDESSTGVPIDLTALSASTSRRTGPATVAGAAAAPGLASARSSTTTEWMQGSASPTGAAIPTPGQSAPGWYHGEANNTLRYWDGQGWNGWTAEWDGKKWVQQPAQPAQ